MILQVPASVADGLTFKEALPVIAIVTTLIFGLVGWSIKQLLARIDRLEAKVAEHSTFKTEAQTLLSPLQAAASHAFADMVFKANPVNAGELTALKLVQEDPTLAGTEAVVIALHACERELRDGELDEVQTNAYRLALFVCQSELMRRGVKVEMGKTKVGAALDAADAAGRPSGEKEDQPLAPAPIVPVETRTEAAERKKN